MINISDEELLIIEEAFNEWASRSQYITGAWIEGDEADYDKDTEYEMFRRKNALEQLKSILKTKCKL